MRRIEKGTVNQRAKRAAFAASSRGRRTHPSPTHEDRLPASAPSVFRSPIGPPPTKKQKTSRAKANREIDKAVTRGQRTGHPFTNTQARAMLGTYGFQGATAVERSLRTAGQRRTAQGPSLEPVSRKKAAKYAVTSRGPTRREGIESALERSGVYRNVPHRGLPRQILETTFGGESVPHLHEWAQSGRGGWEGVALDAALLATTAVPFLRPVAGARGAVVGARVLAAGHGAAAARAAAHVAYEAPGVTSRALGKVGQAARARQAAKAARATRQLRTDIATGKAQPGDVVKGGVILTGKTAHALAGETGGRAAKRIPFEPTLAEAKTTKNLKLKLNPRYAETGVPGNTRLRRQGHHIVGSITPDSWVKRTQSVMPNAKEVLKWARWYREVRPLFNHLFGEQDAEKILRGFAVSQANASPTSGLEATLKVVAKINRGQKPTKGEISTAVESITNAVRGDPVTSGVAAKLSDFANSLEGMKTRTWMAHDPKGGFPTAIDVHSGRDLGYVDDKLVARLEKRDLVKGTDFIVDNPSGTYKGSRYERAVEKYQEITDHLNKMNGGKGWHNRQWTPSEVQAVGWAAIQKFHGREPEDLATAALKNLRHFTASASAEELSAVVEKIGGYVTHVEDGVVHAIASRVEAQKIALRLRRDYGGSTLAWLSNRSKATNHFIAIERSGANRELIDRLAALGFDSGYLTGGEVVVFGSKRRVLFEQALREAEAAGASARGDLIQLERYGKRSIAHPGIHDLPGADVVGPGAGGRAGGGAVSQFQRILPPPARGGKARRAADALSGERGSFTWGREPKPGPEPELPPHLETHVARVDAAIERLKASASSWDYSTGKAALTPDAGRELAALEGEKSNAFRQAGVERPPFEPVEPIPGEQLSAEEGGKQVVGSFSQASRLRREQAALRTQEHAVRTAEYRRLIEADPSEEGRRRALAALSGPMPTIRWSRHMEMTPETLDAMIYYIRSHPSLQGPSKTYTAINTETALRSLVAGNLPRKFEQKLLRDVFGDQRMQDLIDSVGFWNKWAERGAKAVGIPRTLLSSMDLSAPLRQGLLLTISHPVMSAKNVGRMVKAFGSTRVYEDTMMDITSRPTFDLMQKAGLPFTDIGADLGKREEAFASSYAEVITGGKWSPVRASNRAFVSFLNKSRADYFDWLLERARILRPDIDIESPEGEEMLKRFARLAGTATGRGVVKNDTIAKAMPLANAILFSPRLLKSRLDLIANPAYWVTMHKDPISRREFYKHVVGLAATVSGLSTMAYLAGAKVVRDPTNADWGKIKVGNTRFDPAGGFLQPLRLMAQIAEGKVTNSITGEPIPLSTSDFGAKNRGSIVLRFLRTKLSPPATVVTDWFVGTNFSRQPFSVQLEAYNNLMPLLIQDATDLYRQGDNSSADVAAALALYGIGMFGIGAQTYGQAPPTIGTGERGGAIPPPPVVGGGGSPLPPPPVAKP